MDDATVPILLSQTEGPPYGGLLAREGRRFVIYAF